MSHIDFTFSEHLVATDTRGIKRMISIGTILGTSYPRVKERSETEKGRRQLGFKEHNSWMRQGGRI